MSRIIQKSANKNSMQAIIESVIIVSDLHIKETNDTKATLLINLIESIDVSKVEYFILLGDIFDFCFGDSRYFQKKYKKIGESLSSLAQKNINVLFFQGNHEFAISKLRWRHVQFIEEKTKIITLKHGAKIALSHGDTLNAPLHYYFYLFIARSKLIHLLIRLMPSKYLDIFTQKFSRYSRKKNKQHK